MPMTSPSEIKEKGRKNSKKPLPIIIPFPNLGKQNGYLFV
jgi:hypothetical protein